LKTVVDFNVKRQERIKAEQDAEDLAAKEIHTLELSSHLMRISSSLHGLLPDLMLLQAKALELNQVLKKKF